MSEHPTVGSHGGSDGLWRWLLGGLAGGGVLLGLLIAAYAVGYHRGEQHAGTPAASAPAPTTSTATSTTGTAAPTTAAPTAPVALTPALVARGKTLYTSDGCAACHSLSGAPGAGPSLKGLAGASSTLTTGEAVPVDDAYLQRSITDPDAQVVKGYGAGIMSAAIAGFDLGGKPDDVRALVAFIKSQK